MININISILFLINWSIFDIDTFYNHSPFIILYSILNINSNNNDNNMNLLELFFLFMLCIWDKIFIPIIGNHVYLKYQLKQKEEWITKIWNIGLDYTSKPGFEIIFEITLHAH